MAFEAPTNNYMAGVTSVNATITEIVTLPLFGIIGGNGDSCSPTTTSTATAIVDRLQQKLSSIDLSFNIPHHPGVNLFGYSLQLKAFSGKYDVVMPDVQTMLGLQIGLSIAILMGILFAIILYRTVIILHNNNTSSKHCEDKHSPPRRAIIGSTLLLTCIFLPYIIIYILSAHNIATRFTICCCFVLYMFRTLEAIFDFVPTGAKSSLGIYCVYFSLPFDMEFDKHTDKPVIATKRDLVNGVVNAVKAMVFMCIMCSVLSPFGYVPFGNTGAGEFHEGIDVRDYLNARHLGNCFAIALFFQQGLALGDAATGAFIPIVFGYKVKQSLRNPLLASTSCSDFWGRRWNVLVHSVMKRGVYKPVRKYSSSAVVASLAVFMASGLFHEWLVHAVILHNRPLSVSTSEVLLGSNTAFFIWNFVVIVSERLLAGTKGIQSLGKMIPPVFLPFLIIMTSLPMAHWFGNPYLKGGFFADYEQCLPLIRKV